MNGLRGQETAYAFCLDGVRHGHVYYRTVSLFCGSFGVHGRDQRRGLPVIIASFECIMGLLKQPVRWVRNDDDAADWWAAYGWALVPNDYAEQRLGALLSARECLRSAIGLFWDVALPRNRATSRRIPQDVRRRVLERDSHRCIQCGKASADGATLTMDHVVPYSRGGETAEGNLVTLCEACNQGHGNADHSHLFVLARLHHGWDPELLDGVVASDPDARICAVTLSQNIMVSRCKTDDLPMATHSGRGTTA